MKVHKKTKKLFESSKELDELERLIAGSGPRIGSIFLDHSNFLELSARLKKLSEYSTGFIMHSLSNMIIGRHLDIMLKGKGSGLLRKDQNGRYKDAIMGDLLYYINKRGDLEVRQMPDFNNEWEMMIHSDSDFLYFPQIQKNLPIRACTMAEYFPNVMMVGSLPVFADSKYFEKKISDESLGDVLDRVSRRHEYFSSYWDDGPVGSVFIMVTSKRCLNDSDPMIFGLEKKIRSTGTRFIRLVDENNMINDIFKFIHTSTPRREGITHYLSSNSEKVKGGRDCIQFGKFSLRRGNENYYTFPEVIYKKDEVIFVQEIANESNGDGELAKWYQKMMQNYVRNTFTRYGKKDISIKFISPAGS